MIDNIAIPNAESEYPAWIVFFNKLKGPMGKTNAKQIWLYTWSVYEPTFLTSNPEFLAWMKRHNLDVSNAATRGMAAATELGGAAADVVTNLLKTLSVGGPVLIGGAFILALYLLARLKPEDVINVLPATRTAKMAMAATGK